MNIAAKKIVYFIIPSMKGGGAEKVLSIILEHIDRDRFIPKLILFVKTGEYLSRIPGDVDIVSLGKKGRWGFLRLIFKLRQLIRAGRPDVVVSFLDYTNILVVLALLFLKRKSGVIISERSYHRMYLPYTRMGAIREKLMSFTYKKASRIIAISNGIKDAMVEDFHVDRSRVEVIYNPIDVKRIQHLKDEDISHKFFNGNRDVPVLISAGRLDKSKNFALLIKAFAAVRDKMPAYLIILGQGKLEAELKALAARLGVRDYVDFVGFQANPFAWMSRAEVFILPSNWEGFGNVIVEAMACGTPVIATDCPVGPREIINNRGNGILVLPDDVNAMNKAILELSEDMALKDAISKKALEYVEKFDISRILPRYWEAIDVVLRESSK